MENRLKEIEQSMEERWRRLEARVENIDRRSEVRGKTRPLSQDIGWTVTTPAGSTAGEHVSALERCVEAALESLFPHVDALLSELERRIPANAAGVFLPPSPSWPSAPPSSAARSKSTSPRRAASQLIAPTATPRHHVSRSTSRNVNPKIKPPTEHRTSASSHSGRTTGAPSTVSTNRKISGQQIEVASTSMRSVSAVPSKARPSSVIQALLSSSSSDLSALSTGASSSMLPRTPDIHNSTTESRNPIFQSSSGMSQFRDSRIEMSTIKSSSSVFPRTSTSPQHPVTSSSISPSLTSTNQTTTANPGSENLSYLLRQLASELKMPKTQPSDIPVGTSTVLSTASSVKSQTTKDIHLNSSHSASRNVLSRTSHSDTSQTYPFNSSHQVSSSSTSPPQPFNNYVRLTPHPSASQSNSSILSRSPSSPPHTFSSIPSINASTHQTESTPTTTYVENRTTMSASNTSHPSYSQNTHSNSTNPSASTTPRYTVRFAISDQSISINHQHNSQITQSSPSAPSHEPQPVASEQSPAQSSSSNDDGLTPFLRAAKEGRMNDVLAALQDGVDINECDRFGQTALHWAAWYGNTEILSLLLRSGANPSHMRNSFAITPLHVAAANGHAQCVAFLVDAEVEVDARTKSSKTPLHMAAFKGHEVVVNILLAAGANVNAVDADGKTPMDVARTNELRRLMLG